MPFDIWLDFSDGKEPHDRVMFKLSKFGIGRESSN